MKGEVLLSKTKSHIHKIYFTEVLKADAGLNHAAHLSMQYMAT